VVLNPLKISPLAVQMTAATADIVPTNSFSFEGELRDCKVQTLVSVMGGLRMRLLFLFYEFAKYDTNRSVFKSRPWPSMSDPL
jgi:hypothetical protein